MIVLVVGFVVTALLGALIGGAIAVSEHRDGAGTGKINGPCPTCGSVEVVEFDHGSST